MEYEYYAQGVALLRQHGRLTSMQMKQFEAYLGRSFVPTHVENQVRAAVEKLRIENGLNEKRIEGLKASRIESPRNTVFNPSIPQSFNPSPTSTPQSSNPSHGFWAGLAQRRDLPDEIMALRERAIELHKQESLAHGQMGVEARAGNKKQAYELAHEIMEVIRPELDDIYDAVREWEATGKLAVRQLAVGSPEQTVRKLMKRLKYCNERVCRIGGWIRDGYREKTVKGQKAKVILDAKDIQELDNERLRLLVETKEIKEKLGE